MNYVKILFIRISIYIIPMSIHSNFCNYQTFFFLTHQQHFFSHLPFSQSVCMTLSPLFSLTGFTLGFQFFRNQFNTFRCKPMKLERDREERKKKKKFCTFKWWCLFFPNSFSSITFSFIFSFCCFWAFSLLSFYFILSISFQLFLFDPFLFLYKAFCFVLI